MTIEEHFFSLLDLIKDDDDLSSMVGSCFSYLMSYMEEDGCSQFTVQDDTEAYASLMVFPLVFNTAKAANESNY